MKRFLQFLSVMALTLAIGFAEAQTVVSNESFPNSYNTGFARPVNSTFTGSTGTWATFSTDANATIVCNGAYVQTTPNALKIVNYNNSGLSTASTSRATSPTINLGSLGCTNSVALSFKLYTYTLNVNNTCFSFFVEFSSDNGTTWSTVWTRTAQQLVQSFGSGTWTTQNIPIPSNFYNATFKYRLRGTAAAGCAYDSYLYIDDVRVLSQPCLTTCASGFNPTASARGFNVFAKDGAKFMNGHTDGGVAMGGDLTLQGAATIAMNSAFLTYPVTADKFGLVVGGKMVYTSGAISYVNNGKIRLGSTTNSRLFYKDCNNANTNFKVTPFNSTCATAFNTTPALQQQSTSANSDPLDVTGINYADAFTALQKSAMTMMSYSAASSCASSLNIINVSGSTANITLASNKTNVINLTGAQLAALTNITFTNAPTATNPLVINVNQTGSFNWTTPFATTGLTNASGQFIIFNFANATGDITITGSNVIRGTLFAPYAAINWSNANNLEGQAIARYFTLNGGEIHYQRFSACLPECNPANPPCVTNVSLPGGHSAVYQGVNYTTVSGNIRTTFTYTVTSGSAPNISHFIFGNLTCQSCFDGASDLISATQTPVSMGTDPTTGICGLKFDFSVASGQSTTVSFTLNGYYDVGPVVFGTKAGTNTAFGYICGPVCSTTPPTFNLGNLVWFDADGDGLKDVDENGISGVTVNLYADANNDNIADGAAVATTTTNASGNYNFTGLFTGNYIVGIIIPNGYKAGFINGGDPDNNTDNDNNGLYLVSGEQRSKAITLSLSSEPTNDGDGNNGNLTVDFGLIDPATPPKGSGEKCFVGPSNPNVSAQTTWSINPDNNTVTIRATLAKTFVDNTYGTNKIGWPGNHNFSDLVGSDKLTMSLFDGVNAKKMEFTLDYITASSGAPSGYKALGVSGGEGAITTGSAAHVIDATTSIDVNLNDYGYVLLTNSPATNEDYDPNATYPKWIYDVWYEVTVSLSAFGAAGFGDVVLGAIHASPSKTGNNNETVVVGPCPGPLSLGNVVWYDNNNNGIKDAGENGIAGLTVRLYVDADGNNVPDGAATATTTTDANGMYSFDALNNGKYIVGVVLPGGYGNAATVATSSNPNNDTDNDNNGITIVSGELRSNFITLAEATEPTSDGTDNNTNYTLDFGILFTATGGEQCFASPTVPNTVNAKIFWTFNPLNQTVTLRTTFAKTFVDNTYGTGAIGWPSGHTFSNLTGSDKLQLALYDATGVKKLEFEQDYFTASSGAPSGYQSLGVSGGDGGMIVGSASNVVGWKTSMDANFNDYGYILTTNSPATNTSYAPNATYPNWIYDVWYEVTVKLSAFGSAGFGYPRIADVHASPSKTGNNTEVVNPITCPVTKFNIGDVVWVDLNANGIKNSGEPGLAGVTVYLYADANNNNVADGAAIATTVTDADGKYSFGNLDAGNYIVGIVIPTGYSTVATNGGDPDNNIDNDNNGINVVGGEIRSNAITLSANAEPVTDGDGNNGNLTVDFALQTALKVNLGNQVWYDVNNNGLLDIGETGIAGVTVKLYADANTDGVVDGAAVLTTVTNANGVYSFNNLNAGNYIVGVMVPSSFAPSAQVGSSSNPNNNIDNDNNGISLSGGELRSGYITLTPTSEPTSDGDGNNGNLTLDFGFYNPAIPPTGGEKCYIGTNNPSKVGARIQWSVNPTAGTVTIRTTLAKTFVDNTYGTNIIGWPSAHKFSDLTGSDKIQLALFDGLNAKKLEFKLDYITASGAAPSGYKSLGVSGGDGGMISGSASNILDVRTSMDVNFNDYGYVLTTNSPATDANYTTNATYPNWIYDVWYEVTVSLSAFGAAGFGDVTLTSVHASPSKTGNNTEPVTPTTCPNQMKLGNLVWKDIDNDGIKDANEVGIAGVTVNLYADTNGDNIPNGGIIATTTTNASGIYTFSNLAPGDYIVGVVIPSGYAIVGVNGGDPDNNIDNDNNGIAILGNEFRSNTVTLSPYAEPVYDGDDANGNLTVDFAFYQIGNPASLGDFVWNDLNANGIQDPGEPGIQGVTVTINGPTGMATTTTNAQGYYQFTNLAAGTYTVTFTTPNGYLVSPSNQGINDAIDSDPINGTVSVSLVAGESDQTIDAGFYLGLNLGNLVWNDTNGDGQYEPEEPVVSGVTVRLYADANGDNIADGAAIATTTTNANGLYSFNTLMPGNYIVGIVIPTGYESTVTVITSSDPNNDFDDDNNGVNLTGPNVAGTEVRSNYITLSSNGEPNDEGDGANGNLTLDFGLQGLGGIGDFVWNDLDKDGIQDVNEAGIQNVNVTLTYPGGLQVTIQTDENGYYFFPNLGPGSYIVSFETPVGQVPSPSNIGANDAVDSDPIAGVVNVTLAAGQINNTIDAGYYLQICTPIVANCGTGFIRKTTTLVTNGNFSSAITSPAAGNSIASTCSSGIASASAITYNYSGGSFKAQAEYDGVNTRPGGRSFEIITAANLTTALIDGSTVNQLPFPGDATNGVPSSLSWIYHRNDEFSCERVLWEQTATGLVIGKTYTFRFYASNTRTDNQLDPILQIETGGTSGLANGTVQGTPVTLTEAGTANNTALNGWVRFSYTFTATTPNLILKIVDVANSNVSGDEVGITAIGLDVCEKDTDGDCVVDVDDIDDDNDGILDIVESGGCDPLLDSDGDGIPNFRDSNAPGCQPWVDCNNDGINDNYDWDRDGIINELDLDSDNDGILDVQETRAANAVDNNFDGMVDGVDVDGDGLLSTADANDNVIGGPGITPQDLDRDGAPNYLDLDSDGDGLTDITEALELYDTDGLTAGTDVDTDGVRAKGGLYTNVDDNADNFNGFGAKGIKLKDFDADGKPNPYDVDSDQDGITDNVEGQPTCSNKVPCTNDVDGDGVGDCYDVNTSNCTSRTSGGITPYDKDGDGTPDIYDLDTDNDGAPDINEGSGKEGGFVEDYSDVDGDGLIGEFDNFNIVTALSNFTNNVAHGNMGPNGNLDGPIPSGSTAELPQSEPGSCPNVDRDWRNVTILPVTLMEFKGNLNNSIVNLQWKVTNEVNVDRYIIERSTNGTNFTGIAAVNASTSTASVKDYQHPDNISNLNSTVVYYRLVTEDKGGSKSYSNTIVFRLGKAKSTMAINPNPASNFFNVRVQATKEGNAVVRVLDMTGRVVLTNNTKLFTGSNTISFHNTQQLAAGTYSVQMLLNGEVFTEKLVIMH